MTNPEAMETRDQPQPSLAPLLLTIPDAARVLAIGRTTMYELVADGAIEVVHIGRCARVPTEAIRDFLMQLRHAACDLPPTTRRSVTSSEARPLRSMESNAWRL